MTYLEAIQKCMGKSFNPSCIFGVTLATKDLSKTPESVWGINLCSLQGASMTEYFGEVPDSCLARDLVPRHAVDSNKTVAEVLGSMHAFLPEDCPVYLVGSSAATWLYPILKALSDRYTALGSVAWQTFDVKELYSGVTSGETIPEPKEKPTQVFRLLSTFPKLPKFFGLLDMCRDQDVLLPTFTPQPEAKAVATAQLTAKLLKRDYPDE